MKVDVEFGNIFRHWQGRWYKRKGNEKKQRQYISPTGIQVTSKFTCFIKLNFFGCTHKQTLWCESNKACLVLTYISVHRDYV